MAVKHLPATEGKDAAALIATAEKLLAAGKSGAPKQFVAALFARAVPEDLVRYQAPEIAALAEAAWGFLGERKAGAPKIRLVAPVPRAGGEWLKQASVLESSTTTCRSCSTRS